MCSENSEIIVMILEGNCRACIELSNVLWGIDLGFCFLPWHIFGGYLLLLACCRLFVLFCFLQFFNSRGISVNSAGIIINTTITRETDMFLLAQNISNIKLGFMEIIQLTYFAGLLAGFCMLYTAGCQIQCKSTNQICVRICVSYHDKNLTRLTITINCLQFLFN